MQELILTIIQFGLMASTIDLMFTQGMNIPISHLSFFKERPGLLLRSLLAVIVLVPIAALLIIFLVRPSQDVSVGLAILAACPAAPMMLVNIPKAGGEPGFVTSLHLTLGLLSLATTPVILDLLADALNFQAAISPIAIAGQVSVSLFIPVCIGIFFFAMFPRATGIIRRPLAIIGQIISFLTIAIILLLNYHFLLMMDFRSYIAMALMVIVALGIGNFLAPPQPEERTTLALESAARHPGLAFLIASLNFPLEKALPVLIPYLFIFAVISLLYIQLRKKRSSYSGSSERSIPK
jgi:BASS family bile acid:Na+ symporter